LFVRRDGERLESTLLLPTGSAVSPKYGATLSNEKLLELNRSDDKGPLDFDDVTAMGPKVTALILGERGERLLVQEKIERLVIQHDVESAAIPFEALSLGGKQAALKKGVVRRPAHDDLVLSDRPEKPAHVARLKLALVVGSTKNLAKAPSEAAEIQRALADSDIEVVSLLKAEKKETLAVLADPTVDIFHFVGHAFFNEADDKGNGLQCVDEALTLEDLRGQPIGPRVVFFNACQSVRVRGQTVPVPEAARAVAEYILLSGVESFLGTFWPVLDNAAADFSVRVYRELAEGAQLSDAVAAARKSLFDCHKPDWANYALYGNGSFRIKEPTNPATEKIDG
jgi:CHAT domain-containing protein